MYMITYEKQKILLILSAFPDEPIPFEGIDYWNISTEISLFPQATAVLFHLPTLQIDFSKYLIYKEQGQIWIAWSRESGENFLWLEDPYFASLFDLTMGYRQTDSILYPYYKYEYKQKFSELFSNKEKEGNVCMVISSPLNRSKRFEYLSELMRFLPIDSYGKWNKNRVFVNDKGRKSKLDLYRRYKFVIAFENTLEKDYVTEKFYDPLLTESVPIYLGAPNVTEYQPGKNCFVDVTSFESPEKLADFIKACCDDKRMYELFHLWRGHELLPGFVQKLEEQRINPFVRLCKKLDEYLALSPQTENVSSLVKWNDNKLESRTFISVIMPVYNQGNYVQEAIESILRQTFSEFEFIIINDGSTDDSDEKIMLYEDERVIYIRNKDNIGNYRSRNIGIEKAKGQYIAVMDADDIALPTRLEKQLLYLQSNEDVSAIGTAFMFSDTKQQWTHPTDAEVVRTTLLERNCFMHASLMVRSDVLRQLDGYNEQYEYAADYDLLCRIALNGKILNIPDILMIYRRHSEQISNKYARLQKMCADQIRMNYQYSFSRMYNDKVDIYSISHWGIGRIISLYIYAQYKNDHKLEEQADWLLNQFLDRNFLRTESDLYNIGCGLLFLLQNHFVMGDEDWVLEDLDLSLDWECLAIEPYLRTRLYGWIHYLSLRVSSRKCGVTSLLGVKNTQNLISLLGYLDKCDVVDDSVLAGDIRRIHAMKVCPTTTTNLLIPLEQRPDVTFVIAVRIDSEERRTNLDWLINDLSELEDITILILEADRQPCYQLKSRKENVRYFFIEDQNVVFHRTHYLNQLIQMAETSIVGVWDCDVLIHKRQIYDALHRMQKMNATFSFPYDGRYYALSEEKSILVRGGEDIFSTSFVGEDVLTMTSSSVGGAFFVDRDIYLRAGGENEYFYGWGCEDLERVKRMEILGLPVCRAEGPLFHLYHPRKENSWYGSRELELQNRQEFLKVCGMTREELQAYIRTWKWMSDKDLTIC